jgi:hypothetical protein
MRSRSLRYRNAACEMPGLEIASLNVRTLQLAVRSTTLTATFAETTHPCELRGAL